MKHFMARTATALTLSALFGTLVTSASAQLYFNAGGAIKLAGPSGTTTLATVNGGKGFAFSDGGRSLFVATGTGISKVNATTGAVSSFATGLNDAKKIATDAGGNLYTTDGFNLVKFDLAGTKTVVATLPSAATTLGTIAVGAGIAIDNARGFAYVSGARGTSQSTYRIALGTGVGTQMGTISNVTDLALDGGRNNLFNGNFLGNSVQRRTTASTSTANPGLFYDNSGSNQSANIVSGLAYNSADDNLYVAVRASSGGGTNGKILSLAAGGAAGDAETVVFDNIGDPTYIAFAQVPAPSSVAVMALGGMMPLVAIARRRRAAK